MPDILFLLLVEDTEAIRTLLQPWINTIRGYNAAIDTAKGVEEAIVKLSNNSYDIIFFDISAQRSHNLEAYNRIKSILPETTAIVLLTGTDISESTWRQIGADGYIQKTCLSKDEVINKVKAFLRARSFSSIVRRAEYVTQKLSACVGKNGLTI